MAGAGEVLSHPQGRVTWEKRGSSTTLSSLQQARNESAPLADRGGNTRHSPVISGSSIQRPSFVARFEMNGSCDQRSREAKRVYHKQPETGISGSKHSTERDFAPREDRYLRMPRATESRMFTQAGPDPLSSFFPEIIFAVAGHEMDMGNFFNSSQ